MLTLHDYYMGRDKRFPDELTDEKRSNAEEMIDKANQLLEKFGEKRKVNSGWRPASINAGVPGAAPKSKHMTCEAIDLEDKDGSLDEWCMDNLEELASIGLWLEHPDKTPNWCHIQITPPRSGNRVFKP
jgi:hypothetical protein